MIQGLLRACLLQRPAATLKDNPVIPDRFLDDHRDENRGKSEDKTRAHVNNCPGTRDGDGWTRVEWKGRNCDARRESGNFPRYVRECRKEVFLVLVLPRLLQKLKVTNDPPDEVSGNYASSHDNRFHLVFILFQASDGQSHVGATFCRSLTRAPTADSAIIKLFGGCSSPCLEGIRIERHVLVVLDRRWIDDVLIKEWSDSTCDVTHSSLHCAYGEVPSLPRHKGSAPQATF